jgi:cyclic pyranopterin monophosphate synthase
MTKQLTHLDESGRAKMVDVGHKPESERAAMARGAVVMQPATLDLIIEGNVKKGDVLTIAQLAGVMAAKRTGDLIPLCHPLNPTHIEVRCTPKPAESRIEVEAVVRVRGRTGVEMEALTAVAVAALTIYDMAKAVDRSMRLTDIHLVAKEGGQSGPYRAES